MKENIQILNFKTTFEFCLKAYSDFNLLLRLFTLLFYDFFSEEWDIVARNVCAELNWYLSLYGSIMSRARVHEDRDMERDYIEWQSAIDQTELRGIYRSSLCIFLLCVCVFWHAAMINTLPFLFFHTRSFACQNEISVQKDCSMWSTASHIIARSKRCMKDENLRRNEMSFYVEEWRMMERSNKREGNGNCRMEEIFFYWFRCDETRRRRRRRFKDDRRNVRNFSSHACARKKSNKSRGRK